MTCGVYVPTGSTVAITGSNSNPTIDGTHVATNVNATTFSIPVNVNVAPGTAGTVTATGTTLFLCRSLTIHCTRKRNQTVLSRPAKP